MYEIIVSDKAEEQMRKLPREMADRMGCAFERIKIRPHSFVKRLVGSPYYRLRVGDYRVILDIQQTKLIILVLELGHRRNVYKK